MTNPPTRYSKNLEYLYLVTANSSTITSLAATYRNVPVEIASTLPSSKAFDPERRNPTIIPKGVKPENSIISLIKVPFSVLALVKEIP